MNAMVVMDVSLCLTLLPPLREKVARSVG